MMAALMAMTSSWSSFFSSFTGTSVPLTRIIGKVPTFRCRSDAPLSTATLSRSLTCMDSGRLLRAKRGFLRVHVRQPAVRVGDASVDDVEERALQRFGDRTAAAGADLDLVDGAERRHLGGGADHEHLVGGVERLARNDRLGDGIAEIARERHHRISRDAAEDRRPERRRVDAAVADDEDVLAAAFADVAVDVERD